MNRIFARASRFTRLCGDVFAFAITAIFVSSSVSAGPPMPASFVDRFEALKPVLQCLDTAPREQAAGEACLSAAGVSEADIKGNRDLPPEPPQILAAWLMADSAASRELTEAMFSAATNYARCIETGSLNSAVPAGASEERYYAAARAIETACEPLLPDISPALRGEEVKPETYLQWLLSRTMGGITHLYLARTAGWYPNSLIPCYRYGDGRPPSPACAGREMRPIIAPPPATPIPNGRVSPPASPAPHSPAPPPRPPR